MSKLEEPPFVMLFCSIIYGSKSGFESCINELTNEYGDIGLKSSKLDFKSSEYYREEMGEELFRQFVGFRELISRDRIVDIKILADTLEKKFSEDGRRTVNIDPGYLSAEHLILSTGKAYAHRPYLGKGVYADLTLVYRDNRFDSLEWTYPDYKTDIIQSYFYELRKLYLDRLRKGI